ncbi:MAG TPA: DUF1269 domain-containing protein [Jiangellaceae bacterium]|nr:DUF1269 domain-containing protein [Jiangellaceae bacterium]
MATLTVWRFDSTGGAENATAILLRMAQEGDIGVLDAAVVSWPHDQKKPRTRHLTDVTAERAGWGAFWGFLFGLLFFVPLLGTAVGAGVGAMAGHLAETGIDRDFIRSVQERITPGTSALFLLSDHAAMGRIKLEFVGMHPELISTNLTDEQEQKLRQAFSDT